MGELILRAAPRPGVLLLTLNRPDKRNALSAALLIELAQVLDGAAADEAVRCAVLAGDERAFSAGADITEMVERGLAAIEDTRRQRAWRAIETFAKPLVAAVQGFAFGGGHELAMLADIVIAGEHARFGQPEINIGVMPGDGGTQRITRVAGKSLAMKMILTGEPIDAEAALRAGLVAEVVAHGRVLDRALEIAQAIAEKPPITLRLAKQAVLAAYDTPLAAGLREERQAIALAFGTEDRAEGMKAFLEKRPPKFKGR
ncbi:MAG: enoyl-CoA hydratase-related protein [Kiloniellaceae bacterium]